MKIAIAPSLLVWSEEDIESLKEQYRIHAGSIINMFKLIEEHELSIIINPNLLTEILNSFPCSQLSRNWSYFGDFIRVVTNFLSKSLENHKRIISYPSGDFEHISDPSVIKEYFAFELVLQIPPFLAGISDHELETIFLDYQNFGSHLQIKSTSKDVFIELCSTEDFEKYLDSVFGKIYELNIKHHHKSGWGSKLPSELSDQDLQKILNQAVEVNGLSKSYLAYSNKSQTYIRFRKHHKNVFHAYPISSAEVVQIGGVDLEMVPKCD